LRAFIRLKSLEKSKKETRREEKKTKTSMEASNQKKRLRSAGTEEILGALLSDRVMLNTPERVLNMIELPEVGTKDGYTTATALHQMYVVLSGMISSGIDLPNRTEEWLVSRLHRLFHMLIEYSCIRYRDIRSYELTGDHVKWSTNSLIFQIENTILVLLDKITGGRHLQELDVKRLAKRELLFFPACPIRSYTQTQVHLAVMSIASRWTSTPYDDCIPTLLDHLQTRIAYLCVERNQSHVMDGKEGRDKIHSASIKNAINPNDKNLRKEYSCSPDFISDMASTMASMRNSIYLRTLLSQDVVEMVPGRAWERYDSEKLLRGFGVWVVKEAAALESRSFKDDMRTSMLFMAALRPGDYERYTRDHSGRSVTDPGAIVEHVRPPMTAAWWTSQAARGGIPKLVKDQDPLFRSIAMLKTFHQHCNTKAHFEWWAYCFVQEKEVHQKKDYFLIQNEPLVVKQMGEYNVWYKGKFYRTRTAERAIVLWTVTMVTHFDCEFTDQRYEIHKLGFLRDLLFEWNGGKLEEARQYQPLFDDTLSIMDTDEVFCEVFQMF